MSQTRALQLESVLCSVQAKGATSSSNVPAKQSRQNSGVAALITGDCSTDDASEIKTLAVKRTSKYHDKTLSTRCHDETQSTDNRLDRSLTRMSYELTRR